MNFYQNIKSDLIGKVLFPFTSYLMNRRRILSTFKNLKDSQWYAQDHLERIQLKKLLKLVDYANKFIPYYMNKFKEIGLVLEDIKKIEDIKLIPPLSRQELIENRKDLIDIRLQSAVRNADRSTRVLGEPIPFARFRKYKLVRNTSSGSTGAPTVFYEDGSTTAVNWAYDLLLKSWYGFKPGVREARFVRLSTEFLPSDKKLAMRKKLWNQLVLPGMNLSAEDYELVCRELIKFKPKILWGITSALTGLAQYINVNGDLLSSYRPELIITWAAPLYDYEREIINTVFDCPVTRIYSSREVGHIAGMCPHSSFHVNQENLLVETYSNYDGFSTTDRGEITVTTLDKSPMPFIRYRMGDIGELSESNCLCGRGWKVLKSILGRTGEIFITKDGRMIDPNFWGRFFRAEKLIGSINRFQIIYTINKNITIKIEKGNGYDSETENFIKDTFASNFFSETKLTIEYVSRIEPLVSGKYQMVINEVKQEI